MIRGNEMCGRRARGGEEREVESQATTSGVSVNPLEYIVLFEYGNKNNRNSEEEREWKASSRTRLLCKTPASNRTIMPCPTLLEEKYEKTLVSCLAFTRSTTNAN